MAILIFAIAIGIVVSLIVGAVAWPMLGNANSSFLPALGAGVWVVWAIWQSNSNQRANFLHPAPREYKQSKPTIFGRIKTILAESVVQYGNSWRFPTSNTQAGRIVADLSYTDEQEKVDFDTRSKPRKEKVRRWLRLEAQMKTTDKDTTILQLDWYARIEGLNQVACDDVISTFSKSLDSSLGNGVEIINPAVKNSGLVPPWWLVGFTAFVLCGMAGNFISSFGGDENTRTNNDSSARAFQERKNNLNNELVEWQKYKQGKGIQ